MKKLTKEDCGNLISINEIHIHLLNMLIEFANYCEENNIKYYLSGGTLLGAIRHEGFIPWDDDIDINMPRPDCEKMQKLCKGNIGKYKVVPPCQNTAYPLNYWRIYDYSIVVENTYGGRAQTPIYQPLFIDIFPIDGMPESDKETQKIINRINFNKKMLNCTKGWFHGKTFSRKLFHLIFRPFAELLGKEYWRNNIQSIAKTIPYDRAKYIGVLTLGLHAGKEKVVKDEYIPQIDVRFEGYTFKAPAGYHQYLTQLYGDYMQLPPEEKRVSHHGFKIYKNIREI